MARRRSRRRWIVFDAETDPFQHERTPKDFAWGAYDGQQFRHWWRDKDGWLDWITQQKAIAYAHNGGRFDFYLMSTAIGDADGRGTARMIHNRIASIPAGAAELRDSWCVCPIPLSAHDKGTIDYTRFEEDVREQHRDEILTYLERDCRSLYTLLEAFHEEHPGFPLTVPGAGLAALRRIQNIKIPAGNERFDGDFRGFYYGGRVQAFQTGIVEPPGGLRIFDINSAYPWAMMSDHWWGHGFWSCAELPDDPGALARSMVSLEAVSHGALPYRVPGSPLTYPDDAQVRRYDVTGHEVLAGLETGTLRIVRVLECREPIETMSFEGFVRHYWAQKEAAERAGDEAARHVAKITLNGVYGKFAQNPRDFCDYQILADDGSEDHLRDSAKEEYEFGGRIIVGFPTQQPRFHNVATAASVTGAVRAYLWRAICASSGVAYVDTDSIMAEDVRVNVGDALGQWKHEADVTRVAIAGRKLYAATLKPGTFKASKFKDGVKVATKGCKLTAHQVEQVARGGTVRWLSEAPTFSPHLGVTWVKRNIRSTAA